MVLPVAGAAAAPTVPAGFDQRVIVNGLTQPIQTAWAPDGRLFVAEKPGRIRVVSAAGVLRSTPLLDITGRVNSVQDRGLIGIALDPAFASNGHLYYGYTYELNPGAPDSDAPMVARVERITVGADNSISTPTVVLGQDVSGPCPRTADDCIPSDGRSHTVGTLRFAGNGTLFVSLGDGAPYGEVSDLAFRAQEEGTLAGKLLRIDTSGRGVAGHPFCPSVTDLTKACTKLYAKGFRNPYRFTLRGGTPTPMVGDVGWGDREELSRVTPGTNHGWPCHEGERQTVGYSSDPRCLSLYGAGGVTAPIWTYPHAEASAAIVGGPSLPGDGGAYGAGFENDLFVGDYAKGFVSRLDLNPDGTCRTSPCTVKPFATGWLGGTDLGLSPSGNLVWSLFGTGGPDGSVVEIVRAGANRSPVAVATVTAVGPVSSRTYRFSSAGSTDPDGDPLASSWEFGDGSAQGSGTTVDHTYAAGITRAEVRLRVSDGRGAQATATLTVTPGDRPPTPSILAPADGALYSGGVPVTLSGTATDAEDGTLSGTALSWQVTLRHNTHVHVLTDLTGASSSFVPFDDHDADSGYDVTLVATDSAGNRVPSPTIRLQPQTIQLTLRSNPAGVTLGYGDRAVTAPVTRTAAVGYRTTLTAPPTFDWSGRTLPFATWSDGGAAQHRLVVPASNLTLTASYAGAPPDSGPAPPGTVTGPSGPTPPAPAARACRRLRSLVITVGPKGTRRLRGVRVLASRTVLRYRRVDRRRIRADLRRAPRSVKTVRVRARVTNRAERTRTVQLTRSIQRCPGR